MWGGRRRFEGAREGTLDQPAPAAARLDEMTTSSDGSKPNAAAAGGDRPDGPWSSTDQIMEPDGMELNDAALAAAAELERASSVPPPEAGLQAAAESEPEGRT